MEVLRVILTIIFVIICIVLTAIVLQQEGKSSGLGALSGAMSSSETYWSKNKGRSSEAMLERLTKILGAAFVIISIILNLSW